MYCSRTKPSPLPAWGARRALGTWLMVGLFGLAWGPGLYAEEIRSVPGRAGAWSDATMWAGGRVPSTNDTAGICSTVSVERAWVYLETLRVVPRWQGGSALRIGPDAGVDVQQQIQGTAGDGASIELALRGVLSASGMSWGGGLFSVEGGLADLGEDGVSRQGGGGRHHSRSSVAPGGLSLRGRELQRSRLVVSGGGVVAATRLRVYSHSDIEIHGGRVSVGELHLSADDIRLRIRRGTVRVSRVLKSRGEASVDLDGAGEGVLALRGRWDVDRINADLPGIIWLRDGEAVESDDLTLSAGEGWLAGYTVFRGR